MPVVNLLGAWAVLNMWQRGGAAPQMRGMILGAAVLVATQVLVVVVAVIWYRRTSQRDPEAQPDRLREENGIGRSTGVDSVRDRSAGVR